MAMQIFSFIHDYSISESDKKNYILVCYTLFKSISFFPCNIYFIWSEAIQYRKISIVYKMSVSNIFKDTIILSYKQSII